MTHDYIGFLSDNSSNLKPDLNSYEDLKDVIYFYFLYEQKKNFALTFVDLIRMVLYIFDKNEKVKEKSQSKLEYILVDEFQDVNQSQFNLVEVLSEKHKNLFVVGDPDQTIYSWRGSNVKYIVNFEKIFPDVKTIVLNKNYRSNLNILSVSNDLISKNEFRYPKEMIAMQKKSRKTELFCGKKSSEETEFIVDRIKELKDKGSNFKDIVVLYRAHYLSRELEEAFVKNNIPYTIYSGIDFYQRKVVKDAVAYLRVILYQDDISFLRVINYPKRGVGPKKIAILKEYAELNNCSLYEALLNNMEGLFLNNKKVENFVDTLEKVREDFHHYHLSDLFEKIMVETGFEENVRTEGDQNNLDCFTELKSAILHFEQEEQDDATLEEFLTKVSLFSNEKTNVINDSVNLMTIHSSKGLEFPYVFVYKMVENVFPSKRIAKIEEMEEERRLAYAAFTRAEKKLFLSCSPIYGTYQESIYPSRFILELNDKKLKIINAIDTDLKKEAKAYIELRDSQILKSSKNKVDFVKGQPVQHRVFGKGKIISVDLENNNCYVFFEKINNFRTVASEKIEKL